MSKQKSKTLPAAPFRVGDKVLVKHGFMDVDYPDMPLGGWAGTIVEISDNGIYTVRWSEETLASIHPVFKKRCEKDGLEFDQDWLGGDDLEPDTGDPLDIEQPQKITTKPLSSKDQDDRIRKAFGLMSIRVPEPPARMIPLLKTGCVMNACCLAGFPSVLGDSRTWGYTIRRRPFIRCRRLRRSTRRTGRNLSHRRQRARVLAIWAQNRAKKWCPLWCRAIPKMVPILVPYGSHRRCISLHHVALKRASSATKTAIRTIAATLNNVERCCPEAARPTALTIDRKVDPSKVSPTDAQSNFFAIHGL